MQAQQLEFDFSFGIPSIDATYYREGAQDLIRRLVPEDLLEVDGLYLASQRARFADLLPFISWSELNKAPCTLSVLLLCKYRLNACNFFYDMISRWLLPQKRVNVELFFASDVRLPHLTDELLSVAEIVIYLKSAQDVEEVKRNLSVIETEIRLGVVSNYHARRILEFKGLSSDGKTAMVQEKIGSLIQSHSKDFDRGIFTQMQQFLVTCQEDFKKRRDYHHISRIISNLYSLRKVLRQNVEASSHKRHVLAKFLKTKIDMDQSPGSKGRSVLGILVGVHFSHEHEFFEVDHFKTAVQKILPKAKIIEDSPFVDKEKESTIQILYIEIEKQDGNDFTLDEIQLLRSDLPEQIKTSIERLTHPIFMPRNEEEVLRNIMTLSGQLRYVNDLPQTILSLDEQKEDSLCFTVILVRSMLEGSLALSDLLSSAKLGLKITIDRVRKTGRLRGRYVKEATVFRVVVESTPFLRADHSIDFYKARQYVIQKISHLIGEIRDYNGGMLHKQSLLLSSLKSSLGRLQDQQMLFVEKFFYALTPIEMRAVLEVEPLKQFFLLLLQYRKTGQIQKKIDAKKVFIVAPKAVYEKGIGFSVPPYRLISFQVEDQGEMIGGHLLFSEDKEEQSRFLEQIGDSSLAIHSTKNL